MKYRRVGKGERENIRGWEEGVKRMIRGWGEG